MVGKLLPFHTLFQPYLSVYHKVAVHCHILHTQLKAAPLERSEKTFRLIYKKTISILWRNRSSGNFGRMLLSRTVRPALSRRNIRFFSAFLDSCEFENLSFPHPSPACISAQLVPRIANRQSPFQIMLCRKGIAKDRWTLENNDFALSPEFSILNNLPCHQSTNEFATMHRQCPCCRTCEDGHCPTAVERSSNLRACKVA